MLLLLFIPVGLMAGGKINPFARFVGKPYGSYHYALRDTFRHHYYINNYAHMEEGIALLRQLRDRITANGLPLDTLSMGMSHDLEAAIAEGATIVRVGTAIFGERQLRAES